MHHATHDSLKERGNTVFDIVYLQCTSLWLWLSHKDIRLIEIGF